MACVLDYLSFDKFGNVVFGADGHLLAEFKMMEMYLMDVSSSNNYDLFTCAVQDNPLWECLDIASARTLSGSYKSTTM